MKFEIKKGRGFSNEGEQYNAEVIAKKLNGFVVKGQEGGSTFICNDDITIIEISEDERKLKIEL